MAFCVPNRLGARMDERPDRGNKMPDDHDSLLVDRPTKTLRELALDRMRKAIVDLHFRPGERLVERDLCTQLGVSRTIVREVLRHLESEGLVATQGARGPIVAVTGPEEALQIYELRGLLEGVAARGCAESEDRTFLGPLEESLAAIEEAYRVGDMAGVLTATSEFYRILFEASSKTIARGIVTSLTARINHLRSMTIKTPKRNVDGPREMRRIVRAIRKRDGDEAFLAAQVHVQQASEIAQRLLRSREAS
jgi:DNA-binding GntR family transcriptional regulator